MSAISKPSGAPLPPPSPFSQGAQKAAATGPTVALTQLGAVATTEEAHRRQRAIEKLLELQQMLEHLPIEKRDGVRALLTQASVALTRGDLGTAEEFIKQAERAMGHTVVNRPQEPKPVEKPKEAGNETGFGRDRNRVSELAALEAKRAKEMQQLADQNEQVILARIAVPPPPQV